MTATTSEPALQRRAPRWMWVVLIISLAANILVIGAIGGGLWAFRHGGPWAHRGMTTSLLGYVSTLPKERREVLWRIAREHRAEFRPIRAEARAARQAVRDALKTEPFDRAAFDAAQSKALAVEARARAVGIGLLGDVASKLTADERRAFASWREQRRSRWRWSRGSRHWFDDDEGAEEQRQRRQ